MDIIDIGTPLICAETGKRFLAAKDGCSFNFARSASGEILSDEGVHIREVRRMLDRTRPFGCYLSGDGKHVTGWKGNKLGDVVRLNVVVYRRGRWGQADMVTVRVVDVHGGVWHGRGAGRGMSITLRPSKARV